MNKLSILSLIISASILFSCQDQASGIENQSSVEEYTTESIETTDTITSPVKIIDSNIIAFIDQFEFDFPDTIDFGWRFIESNYDTSAVEVKGIKYNEKYILNNIHFFNLDGEPLGKEIQGYAHSYKELNEDSLAILTIVNGEISQGINLYITDNDLNVLSKSLVASNGGDEGTWFYKYGHFDSEFTHFCSERVAGFAVDTSEILLDTIWIKK